MEHHKIRAHLFWSLSPRARETVENLLCDPLLRFSNILMRLQLSTVACVSCRPVERAVYPAGQRQRRCSVIALFRQSDNRRETPLTHGVVVELLKLLAIWDELGRLGPQRNRPAENH